MRAHLRRLFNTVMGWVPAGVIRVLLKTFADCPGLGLRAGFRVYPRRYDSPLVDPAEVDRGRLDRPRSLPGIRFDLGAIEAWVEQLRPYGPELETLPRAPGSRNVVWSETYPSIDTAFLYAMLRHLKPRRYIEVGCGCSSRVSSLALRRNEAEGHTCRATYIEPYPGPRLAGVDLFGDLLVERIEQVPLATFTELQERDVLFIDTSHVIKCQNDVEYELLHILPSLRRGVYVHIHDIFTPYDIAEEFVLGPRAYWGAFNEQYAVECLLSGGDAFRVVLPLHYLGRDHRALAERLIPGVTDRGQALWLVKQTDPLPRERP
ncbi:class I SAM-dependent methyltransferase [bacterium]|nr:class I SAM-dependent methyltransferase [bacterium]